MSKTWSSWHFAFEEQLSDARDFRHGATCHLLPHLWAAVRPGGERHRRADRRRSTRPRQPNVPGLLLPERSRLWRAPPGTESPRHLTTAGRGRLRTSGPRVRNSGDRRTLRTGPRPARTSEHWRVPGHSELLLDPDATDARGLDPSRRHVQGVLGVDHRSVREVDRSDADGLLRLRFARLVDERRDDADRRESAGFPHRRVGLQLSGRQPAGAPSAGEGTRHEADRRRSSPDRDGAPRGPLPPGSSGRGCHPARRRHQHHVQRGVARQRVLRAACRQRRPSPEGGVRSLGGACQYALWRARRGHRRRCDPVRNRAVAVARSPGRDRTCLRVPTSRNTSSRA